MGGEPVLGLKELLRFQETQLYRLSFLSWEFGVWLTLGLCRGSVLNRGALKQVPLEPCGLK